MYLLGVVRETIYTAVNATNIKGHHTTRWVSAGGPPKKMSNET